MLPLPIDAVLPEVLAALKANSALVLRAPTGAGKTTRVAPALLRAGLADRGLDSELALGIARLLQQTVRPDLKLVVMSATLAVDPVVAYLGGCPVVASEGRLYPVDVQYEPRSLQDPWPEAAAQATQRLLD